MDHSLTYRDVVDILTLIKSAGRCRSAVIEVGDFKISITGQDSAESARSVEPAAAAPGVAAAARTLDVAAKAAAPLAAAPAAVPEADGHYVRAPMLGTFYRALEPGARPCVEVGDVVGPEDTIGLIEVMKLFSTVTAGIRGRVVEILAENSALVEFDQPLVRIQPED